MKCVEYDLFDKVGEVLFSPSATELAPRDLACWILRDGDPVRMQLQLHKVIWGDEPGR
jgi:7-carboxy-7-deazaguanine synthase